MLKGFVPWPPDLAERYRREGYWEDITITEMVYRRCDAFPDRMAVIDGGTYLSYGELKRRVEQPEWEGSDLTLAAWTKMLCDAPVIAVGSVGQQVDVMTNLIEDVDAGSPLIVPHLEILSEQFAKGYFDLFAAGRALIADPAWVRKIRDGEQDKIIQFNKQMVLDDLDWDPEQAELDKD